MDDETPKSTHGSKTLRRERNSVSTLRSHSMKANLQFMGTKNEEMIKPASLNVPFSEDVTSHVLSFKCIFCNAYIFTLQSFMIHLKSSHSNEDISEMLNNQFRSCIAWVEKEKVVIVAYAFPRGDDDVDVYWNTNDNGSSNSDTSLCSLKSSNRCDDLEDEKQEAANNGGSVSTVTSGTVSNEQTSLDGARDGASNNVPTLLAESTRRRQMSSFEKMMALTCQKCGQKFKNRCMLTRHAIEHKRASNPYRCTADGCLDSYAEKRKLIAHINYKHTELSRKEREVMVMKGDALLRELRNISSIESTTTDNAGLHFPSLSEAETISISVTATNAADGDQSLMPPSSSITDIISSNHILRNMVESVGRDQSDEMLSKTVKSVNFNNVDTAPCFGNLTASKCSATDATQHSRSVKSGRSGKMEVCAVSSTILKRNSGSRSLAAVPELLGSDVTNKRRPKRRNESLLTAKYFVKSEFSTKTGKTRKNII
ncbi:unnamed protein product [Litomosoides sigmodontis]|uniref:C2H2-type domain-containing protein n=1 Tax=Litomosoides sigmodontis TaxID=42156 RepID=A0A3P6TR39_LITSI|nr:unnamed protein product [Litomosoides sigmodontis]